MPLSPELQRYVQYVLGNRAGWVAVAFGRHPYFDERGRYQHTVFHQSMLEWPAKLENLLFVIDEATANGDPVDVYICPYIRTEPRRWKDEALPPMLCHVDLDGPPADPGLWAELEPLVVRSGQDGHVHGYIPLQRPVTLEQHSAFQTVLRDRLGADHKIADNDLLRWPGSINHKPATKPNTGEPAPVVLEMSSPKVWDPAELAGLLGVDLDAVPDSRSTDSRTGAEPVDPPWIPEWLRDRFVEAVDPEDRSAAFHGLVGACRDAGLTEPETVALMEAWPPGVAKYGAKVAAEVARSWAKVTPPAGLPEDGSESGPVLPEGGSEDEDEDGAPDPDEPGERMGPVSKRARRFQRPLHVGGHPVAVDWLRDRLGTGPLAGYFLRDGELVHCPAEGEDGYIPPANDRDHDGPAQVRMVTAGNVAARITFTYNCYTEKIVERPDPETGKPTKHRERRSTTFAKQAAQVCLDAPDMMPNLRRLLGVTHTPLVRRDGSVLGVPGFDAATGLLYLPAAGLRMPPVLEAPTEADVRAAVALLLQMIAEFPFVGDNDRANFLGLLLTPVLRELVGPPYKLGVFTAPMRRSGKTLLASVLRLVHGGVFRSEVPADEAEIHKTLSTILNVTTAPVVTFDNVTGILKSGTLDGMLSSATFDARQLGSTKELIQRRNDRLWTITSNNAQLGGDLIPRALWVSINPGEPHPERRTGFAISDLQGWVLAHRGEILAALLTLVRWWVLQGRPVDEVGDIYGRWVGTVRRILQTAGVAGTFDAVESMAQQVTDEDEEAARFLEAAEAVVGTEHSWLVRDLLEHVGIETALPMVVADKPAGSARALSLGKWLRFRVNAWFGEDPPRSLVAVGKPGAHGQRWKIAKFGEPI